MILFGSFVSRWHFVSRFALFCILRAAGAQRFMYALASVFVFRFILRRPGPGADAQSLGHTPGYFECFALFVQAPLDIASRWNQMRQRTLPDEELRKTHEKVQRTVFPSDFGGGLQAEFGNRFFEVTNDGSPASNNEVQSIIKKIISL